MLHPALIATALHMQASLEAPLRLDILDYYSLYIRTQSSTRKDSNSLLTLSLVLLLSIRLRSRARSLYPADSTPCPADTLLPKRVADLISLHFTELVLSVFASLHYRQSEIPEVQIVEREAREMHDAAREM